MPSSTKDSEQAVLISAENVTLEGILHLPLAAQGLVLFAHGSGSSRFSRRNHFVATLLNQAHLATLLFDLLTPTEEAQDLITMEYRFDIPFLATRLNSATEWCQEQIGLQNLPIGYFGASTGGGAALVSGAKNNSLVKAIVSRGGRPDLADTALPLVKAPTLLIVGGEDPQVIELNKLAMKKMTNINKLEIIPGATHLFEESGALEQVAAFSRDWFLKYLI